MAWSSQARRAAMSRATTLRPSRVSWEITPLGEVCKLTVVHDAFAAGETATYRMVSRGWPFVLSNLKTLLETGEPLRPGDGFPPARRS